MATLISRENPRILSVQSLEAHQRSRLASSVDWFKEASLGEANAHRLSKTKCRLCRRGGLDSLDCQNIEENSSQCGASAAERAINKESSQQELLDQRYPGCGGSDF